MAIRCTSIASPMGLFGIAYMFPQIPLRMRIFGVEMVTMSESPKNSLISEYNSLVLLLKESAEVWISAGRNLRRSDRVHGCGCFGSVLDVVVNICVLDHVPCMLPIPCAIVVFRPTFTLEEYHT